MGCPKPCSVRSRERKRAQEALVELNATLEKQVTERTEQLRKKRGSAAPSAEHGSCRTVDWRRGARRQQSAAGHHRQSRHHSAKSADRIGPSPASRQICVERSSTCCQPDTTASSVLASAASRSKPIDVNMLVNGLSDMVHRTLARRSRWRPCSGQDCGAWKPIPPNWRASVSPS